MKKKKIKIVWSCSDHKHHEHKYKFTAYLCGRLQYVFAKLKNGFCVSSVVRRCGNRIRFIWLYRYMRKHSADARSPHYGFATGRIKGYLWRLFQEPVCFVGINDNGYQSEWPAYYTRKEIKFWIKNN